MNLLYDKLTALGFEVEAPYSTFYIFPKALEGCQRFLHEGLEFDLLVPSELRCHGRLACCIDTERSGAARWP